MLDITKGESEPEIKISHSKKIGEEQDDSENKNLENIEDMKNFLNKHCPSFREKFELLEFIEGGRNCIVYKGKLLKNKNDRRLYFFKFCFHKKKNNKFPKYSEIIIQIRLKKLRYTNMILSNYYAINDKDYFSVSELGKFGNIDNFLHNYLKRNYLSESFLNYIAKPILEALNYLHRKKIIHMNIQTGNIILDSELDVKIIDFYSSIDFSNFKPEDLITLPIIGTGLYMSPERLKNGKIEAKYGDKIDIYSLGVTLYNLAFGNYPYDLNNLKDDEIDKIYKQLNLATLKFSDDKKISNYFKNFLSNVLKKDYKERYSIKEALNDPWIKGWDIINEEKENIGITEELIKILFFDNIPRFNQYINNKPN